MGPATACLSVSSRLVCVRARVIEAVSVHALLLMRHTCWEHAKKNVRTHTHTHTLRASSCVPVACYTWTATCPKSAIASLTAVAEPWQTRRSIPQRCLRSPPQIYHLRQKRRITWKMMTDQTMRWLSPANVSRIPTTFRILRMVVRSRASNRISSARLNKQLHILKVQEDLEALRTTSGLAILDHARGKLTHTQGVVLWRTQVAWTERDRAWLEMDAPHLVSSL